MLKFLFYLLFSILSVTSLLATSSMNDFNTQIDYFTKNSANDLYNLNEVAIQDNIKTLFSVEAIQAVEIKDAFSGDTFIAAYKNANKININLPFPAEINLLPTIEKSIYYNREIIGKSIIHYHKMGADDIKLTEDEMNWLSNHQTLKIGNEPDYAPWDFNKDGVPIGYSVDYVNLLASKLGIKVKYMLDSWNNLVKKLANKEVDILHTMFKNNSRIGVVYSDSYKKVINAIIVNENNNDIKGLNDLAVKTVSIPKGDSTIASLKEQFANIKISETGSYIDAIKEVAFNKSDATILELGVASYFIKEYNIPNMKIVGEVYFPSSDIDYSFRFGIRDDYPILVSILNKAMQSVSQKELNELDEKWLDEKVNSEHKKAQIKLSPEEKSWLNQHKNIRFAGDPNWLPFEAYNEDNEYIGIVSDYLKIIEEVTGINFELIQTKNFDESVSLVKRNGIDVISEIVDSELKKDLIFTNPYIGNPLVIVMNEKENFVEDLENIKDKKIAIIKNYGYFPKVKQKYPNIKFENVETIQDGLSAVSTSKVDAFVCTSMLGSYHITKMGLSNIKIVGKTKVVTELGLGVRKDFAPLVSILNKALESITKEEQSSIFGKWISVNIEQETNWKLILQIAGIGFLIFAFILYNNRKLAKLVGKKTSELQSLLSSFDTNVIASNTDTHGIITYTSDALCKISGYSREELIGKSHRILRHPDMPKELFTDLWASIKTNQVWKGEIKNRKKDGGYYWVDVIITPKRNQQDKLVGYSAIRQDITDKKAVEELSVQQAAQMYEIERSNRLLSGRENRMVELKKQINEYKVKLGENVPYSIADVEDIIIEENIDLDNKEEEEADLKVLLDVEQLQSMMESFYKIMHIPLAIIDLNANILVSSKWQRSCTDFHRANAESCKRCIASDMGLANELEEGKNFTSYKCSNGLIDCASPIIIHGKHVANFFIGQFLINEPDMEFFTAQAKLFGYDLEDYLNSIRDIPVIKEEKLPFILGFLTEITNVVTSISIEKIRAQKNETINRLRAIEMQKGQIAAMNLAEDAEKARLEVENYKEHLELLVEKRTEELNEQKQFVQTLLDSQEQIIVTTDGLSLLTANKSFMKFYKVESVEAFIQDHGMNCICDTFNTNAPDGYIQKIMDDETWIDYIITRNYSDITHKIMITRENVDYIFSVTAAPLPGNKGLKSAVFTNITAIETAKQEVEAIHKHTRESIEYASLIQGALVPDNNTFENYFSDFFTIWQPKDIVGGDIYLFEELRDRDECLVMVIDCTGHGVPGAFVTMLVKAIERQVVAKIENDENINVSPAWILSYFNRTMKKLLHQDNEKSISNAGFDGGIIYYNKKEKSIKYAGAETALFYIDKEDELQTLKGSRHSIGYKKSDANFQFKEHVIKVQEGMKFYVTTDGYIDQNGGEKGFPYGKRKFGELIINNKAQDFSNQKEVLLNALAEYQGDEARNDDVTVVGFKI